MKAALFINAGLGDAVLLIPLLKAIKASGYHVTAIFQSQFVSQALFEETSLIDCSVTLPNKASLMTWSLRHVKAFDCVFLNNFAATPTNLVISRIIGKQIVASIIGNRRHLLLGANATVLEPKPAIHDALQNLRLADTNVSHLTLEALAIPDACLQTRFCQHDLSLPHPYVAVQICAANQRLHHKTWPQEHWIAWLRLASARYPRYQWVLLGEPAEKTFAEQIMSEGIPNVISKVGETSLSQVMQIIYHAQLLVGLDSGLLHIAVAFGKPTFTLWGGSSPVLYGYESINPIRHQCLSAKLPCSPCNAWMNPNISRVTDPQECPDFACMRALNPTVVFKHFQRYHDQLESHLCAALPGSSS